MKNEIRKAKLTKGRTVEVELIEHLDDKTDRTVSMKCDQLYHEDLGKAFDRLKAHIVCICDQKEAMQIKDLNDIPEDLLNEIKVTSFIISGNDDTEGVVLVGQKRIGEKVLNLISPFTMYEDPYDFANELAADIASCVYEVEQYLFEGKYAVKQLEMEFPEDTKDPDSPEFDQETCQVANAVLSAVIEGNKGRKKGGKKVKTVELEEAV